MRWVTCGIDSILAAVLQAAAAEAQELQRQLKALAAESDKLQGSTAAQIRQLQQVTPHLVLHCLPLSPL